MGDIRFEAEASLNVVRSGLYAYLAADVHNDDLDEETFCNFTRVLFRPGLPHSERHDRNVELYPRVIMFLATDQYDTTNKHLVDQRQAMLRDMVCPVLDRE